MQKYLTNTYEITQLADAIREKGGEMILLSYPEGFISALEKIVSGEGVHDKIATRDNSFTSFTNNALSIVGTYGLACCSSLSVVTLKNCSIISAYAFYQCVNLISLYLPGSSVVTLVNSVAFNSTPISEYTSVAGRYGSIYVPASLINEYKIANQWSIYSKRITQI